MNQSHKAITALLEKLKQAPIPGGCKELMDDVEMEMAKESRGNEIADETLSTMIAEIRALSPSEIESRLDKYEGKSIGEMLNKSVIAHQPSESDVINAWFGREGEHAN